MANDELWRWAEPDGKQREVTLEELRIAFSRGVLVTNTPVWRKGFSDWRPAVEVSELKASVLSGARVPTPKGASLPGKSVAQRGGAAATEEEPPSPPVYTPTAKPLPGRPSAPSLDLKSDGDGESQPRRPTMPMPRGTEDASRGDAPRERAATLIIHAGAPPAHEKSADGTAAPIVVPSAEPDKAPRTITQPPPVSDDAAIVADVPAPAPAKTPAAPAVVPTSDPTPSAPATARAPAPPEPSSAPETPRVPVLPPSASQVAAAKAAAQEAAVQLLSPDSVPTREVPVAEISERDVSPAAAMAAAAARMAVDSTQKLPALTDSVPADVSTSMILSDSSSDLPDSSGAFEPVSTANLLATDSAPESVEPASTEELSTDDLMPASVRPPPVRTSVAPPLDKTVSLPPRLDRTVSIRPRQPSIPPPIPVSAQEAADRMGMGRLPPPDISMDEERAQRSAATLPPSGEVGASGMPAGVPWVGVIIALGAVGFGAYYMGRLGGDTPQGTPTATAAATTSGAPTATVALSASAAPDTTPKELRCKLTANARSLAPKTIVSVGIDVAAANDAYAVGYATSPRDAVAVRFDASFAPLDMVRGKAPSDLRRVVPILGDKIAVLGEIDTPVSGVQKRRLARGSSAYVGLAKEHFVWGKSDSAPPEQLLTMASAKVEALRATAFTEGNVAFAYRSDGAIWVGTSQSGDVPQRFAGLGGGVGSPALAAVGNSIMVVWADRKSADDPWVLRIGEHRPGTTPPEPKTFVSAGGLGGARLSPALTSAGDDRALLVWTDEGSRGGDIVHEVRGQVIDKKGASIGAAFSVSMPDQNAGQPQVALSLAAGDKGLRGLAAFLVATDSGFEVAGAPLTCGRE